MGQTESEKLVADTLRFLSDAGLVTWAHRLEAETRGGRWRTPAPLDFLVATSRTRVVFLEVKEQAATSLPYGHFKPEQRYLLNQLMDAYLVLRFSTADYTRAHTAYWEYYVWCPGNVAPSPEQNGSLSLATLLEQADCPDSDVSLLASHAHGVKKGFGAEHGLTTKGNPTRGLTELWSCLSVC